MLASVIYSETLSALRMLTRRIVHQGGAYSGKTVNILAALATLCVEEVNEDAGVTTVTSMSFPHLKGGALRDFEMYVYPEFKHAIQSYNRTDHIFKFKSGSSLEFKVFENEMSARGQKRKRLFINEANKFDYMVWFQLDSRSEQSIIDYNPSINFWAHSKVIGEPGTTLFISDHRHNPFLSDSKHDEIEGIKDPELWKVYARGLTGNITGIIFPNWEIIDDDAWDSDADTYYWGLDFGYTNDPTVITKSYIVGNTLVVKELCYEPGMPPIAQAQVLKANGWNYAEDVIHCDHDPEGIRMLRNLGINAQPARKGAGSISAGIELLKTYQVKYTASSRNLHRERGMYVWLQDKQGNTLNVPVDNNNHTFDAIRYSIFSRFLREGVIA